MITKVDFIEITSSYKKENGLWVLHLNEINFPAGFICVEESVISIPAGQFGGNHKHARIELFIAYSDDFYLLWQDNSGIKHEEKMYDGSKIKLWTMPAFIPHTVVNKGKTNGMLSEFANAKQHDVEVVNLI